MTDDTLSNGPGLALTEDPNDLIAQLREVHAHLRSVTPEPMAVRIRMSGAAWASVRETVPEAEPTPLPHVAGVEVTIDDALPLDLALVQMSDGTVRMLDLRRAADAREET